MAASDADVRSILSIPNPPTAGASTQAKKPQAAERAKKPEGIPRELYALIGPAAPTLAAQFAKPKLKQKTAYEILRSDWSSDVCSSDLNEAGG